jgi:hypothetical protein
VTSRRSFRAQDVALAGATRLEQGLRGLQQLDVARDGLLGHLDQARRQDGLVVGRLRVGLHVQDLRLQPRLLDHQVVIGVGDLASRHVGTSAAQQRLAYLDAQPRVVVAGVVARVVADRLVGQSEGPARHQLLLHERDASTRVVLLVRVPFQVLVPEATRLQVEAQRGVELGLGDRDLLGEGVDRLLCDLDLQVVLERHSHGLFEREPARARSQRRELAGLTGLAPGLVDDAPHLVEVELLDVADDQALARGTLGLDGLRGGLVRQRQQRGDPEQRSG